MAILFLLAAIAADAAAAHGVAFYLLLGAVVATAHAALSVYGRLVDLPGNAPEIGATRLQATLGVCSLALVVVAAAVRAPALGETVPAVGLSALVASLALLGLQAVVRLAIR